MTKTLISIQTQIDNSLYIFNVETEEQALDKFAQQSGYRDYTALADACSDSVERAKADLVIKHVTLREALSEIIDDALASYAKADGAEDPFKSSADWADWCMDGMTGDEANLFAQQNGLDVDDVFNTVEKALREREIDDINAPFADREEAKLPTLDDAISAWKRATTQADRDLAEEAIEQHIAHEVPEGADYVAPTAALIEVLKKECGPVADEAREAA